MDGSFFGIPIATDARNAISMDGTCLQATPSALVRLDQFSIENQNHKSVDCCGYSSFTAEQLDLCTEFHSRNQTMAMYSDALVGSPGRIITKEQVPSSSNVAASSEFQEQYFGAMPLSASALATLLASRSDLQENLNSLTISAASSYPPEVFRTHLPSDCSNSLKSSFDSAATGNGCDEMFDNIYGKGALQSIPAHVDIATARPVRAGFQPCSASRNVESGGWISGNGNASIDDQYDSRRFTNELSLSLATSQHSIMNHENIPDQCSEIDCPTASQHSGKETRLSSEQTSCNTRELGLRTRLHGHGQVSQAVAGSRFLEVIQEILTQIASYSLENLDQLSYSACGMKTAQNGLFSSGCHVEGVSLLGSNEPPYADGGFNIEMDPALQRRALEAKKRQLLTLLEVVDERYSQCLDEIHTVVSAFHAATELDPQLHTRFALQTMTFLYRGLREKISNQILAIGAHSESSSSREVQVSSETSYLQKQWTLHQLKRKDHQLWRPQRGLPERSVSVLRAWMFQNFLHPYPKDSEKHLLAIKSGLTRSQVSNWFINARVRLWKPMIEEMYVEMNKRKPLQKGEGTNSSQGRHTALSIPHFNMNQNC